MISGQILTTCRSEFTKDFLKVEKNSARKLDFKDIKKVSMEIRDIHKIAKRNCISISVFGYENKETDPIYMTKNNTFKRHVDLLLIGEKGKECYVLIKNFSTFIYHHTLHLCHKFLSLLFTSF